MQSGQCCSKTHPNFAIEHCCRLIGIEDSLKQFYARQHLGKSLDLAWTIWCTDFLNLDRNQRKEYEKVMIQVLAPLLSKNVDVSINSFKVTAKESVLGPDWTAENWQQRTSPDLISGGHRDFRIACNIKFRIYFRLEPNISEQACRPLVKYKCLHLVVLDIPQVLNPDWGVDDLNQIRTYL